MRGQCKNRKFWKLRFRKKAELFYSREGLRRLEDRRSPETVMWKQAAYQPFILLSLTNLRGAVEPTRPGHWYKNAVLYGLDVATFQDSNRDGIGDFPGLISRLDYLTDLGVTCLWLLPFFLSSNRDNGFDVTDYFGVDPRLGTFDEFRTFVHEAEERGLRVLIDLVMDHTTDEHPWFRAADRGSRYRRYYTWTDNPPPLEPGKGNIFPDREASVWTFDEIAGQYYYHRFYHFEPDLDVMCPEVREEIKRVIDFWLSFGVSGFRVDPVSHMIESPIPIKDPGLAHDPRRVLRDLPDVRVVPQSRCGSARRGRRETGGTGGIFRRWSGNNPPISYRLIEGVFPH